MLITKRIWKKIVRQQVKKMGSFKSKKDGIETNKI